MNINDLAGSLDEQNKKQQRQQEKTSQATAANQNTDKVVNAVDKNAQSTANALKDVKGEVKVTNPDLAKTDDVNQVVDSINKMNITTFMGAGGYQDMAANMKALANEVQTLQQKFQQEGLTSLSGSFTSLVNKLAEISKQLNGTKVSVDDSFTKAMAGLKKSIDGIDFKPSVNVSAPETKVVTTPVDFKPVLNALAGVEQAIKDSEAPETEVDLSPVTSGLAAVQKAITALRFPVPNYVLPFVTNAGKATQVSLDSNGNLPMTISGTVVVDDLAAAPTGAAVPVNAQYQGNLAQTALPTAATAGNLTGALADKFGRTVVIPGTIRDLVGTQTTTISASTSETTIVAAAAAIFNDLTALVISNTSATATRVDFRDTTAGSILFSFYVPAGDTRGATYSRPLPQTSVNTNWTAQSSASITDLRIYAVWDKNK